MKQIKQIKQKINTVHLLLDELPETMQNRRYGLYLLFLMDALATLLSLGVLYGIFYLYLQDRINLGLCVLALSASVLIKLWVSYLKINRQAVILEKLNVLITQRIFANVLNKHDDDYNQSSFEIEQLGNRIDRCLMSYFELFANFSLFLIVFILMLFKTTIIATLAGYVLLAVVLLRQLNKKKKKTELLFDKYRLKKWGFISDTLQLKETIKGIGHGENVPERFAIVNRKYFRLKRWVVGFQLTRFSVVEIFTIFYLIACFLLWTALYEKEQVLLFLSIMVLLTAQLFPKAIKAMFHYYDMQDNFSFVEKYFALKDEAVSKAFQGTGELQYNEQSLVIKNLTLRYDKRLLLERSNLNLPAKGHFILNAANGAGKSTLLKWIAEQMASTTTRAYYIPQKLHVYHGTILENIKLFSKTYTQEDIDSALEISGFNEIMKRKGYTLSSVIREQELSGGEKTKLVLSSLLYYQKNIAVLLIDEMTASLDTDSKQYFYRILAENMADKLIIEITHETHYCDNPQYIEIVDCELKLSETKEA